VEIDVAAYEFESRPRLGVVLALAAEIAISLQWLSTD
jgi:hypothetical protein